MKKQLLAVAIGAMLAAGAAAAATRDSVFDLVATARTLWHDPFPEVSMLAAPVQPVPVQQPRTLLAVSKAWMARLAQRLRPTVTSRWRLCASV